MADDISCRELTEFIQRYLDGELPKEEAETFEEHLGLCPPCIRYLDSYKTTVQLEKACAPGSEPMPEQLVQGIVEAMKKRRS